ARATWRDHAIRDHWSEQVDRSIHPHIKPIGLITRLIGAVTQPSDLVVDFAAGSFVVMHAARRLGRNFIGCDLMEVWSEDPLDPGIRGGLAIVEQGENGPHLLAAIDVPVVGSGAKERVDVIALQQWLLQHAPYRAFIERAQSYPAQGASSGFKFGR